MAYVSQKQLGGVITFSDITASGSVGVAADLGAARSLIFDQSTPSISITLVNPSPLDDRLLTIVNRGTATLTINGLVIPPGPAYGIYWNGSSYIAQAVEGVGTVSNVAASQGISLDGDGSSIDPLTATLLISQVIGNALTMKSDGIFAQGYPDVGAGKELWVDTVAGDDVNGTGTQRKPFATLTKASSVQTAGDLIHLVSGTYTETVTLSSTKNFYVGNGGYGGHSVGIVGATKFSGTGQYLLLRDIDFSGSGIPVNIQSFSGTLVFDNCKISAGGNVAVSFTGDCDCDVFFNNTTINGLVQAADWNTGYTGNINIYATGGAIGPQLNINRRALTAVIANFGESGSITHGDGVVIVQNTRLLPDGSGNGVNSTATNANGAALILDDVSFAVGDASGTFIDLVKSGNCAYMFTNLTIAESNGTFTGTQVLGSNAFLISADFASPVNYAPGGKTIDAHLKAIDIKLGSVAGGLSSVTTSNGQTVNFGGAGTVASPLTAAVNVSTAANNAIVKNVDGLYVSTISTGLSEVTHDNSDTVSLTGSGTVADPLIAEAFISGTTHNTLTKDAGGLYVPEVPKKIELTLTIDYAWLEGQVLFNYLPTSDFTLPATIPGFQGAVSADTPITSQLILRKNSTDIGFITIIANVIHASLATSVSFTSGDILTVITQDVQEFNFVSFTLVGQRPFTTP